MLNTTIKRIIYNPQDKLNALLAFVMCESEPGEEWRELKEGHGFYFASNKGRILSIYNNLPMILKPDTINGYEYVKIDGEMKRVNRLIAMTYIPNPSGLPVVHHRDGVKRNNQVENLSWVSHSTNTKEYWKRKKAQEKK